MSEMNNLERMCRAHFNEPMISFGELVRCVGYAEDELDAYIITKRKDGTSLWNTCVGGYMWLTVLKGQGVVYAHNGEIWNDFTRLDSELSSAGCSPEDNFIIEMEDRPHD